MHRIVIKNNLETYVYEKQQQSSLTTNSIPDIGSPFFPGGPELWHHPLAYSTAGELPGALQHATLVHPALHPQVPVRSYL